eukprot:Partr_v1_DN28501_c0_g1_i14_m73442 putative Binds to actin and affects the structure of the cytoskeleton. At high concentrations, profilin prevents the polymerization of actin, whereas it enhances it at low concentrations (By
MSWQAYVDTNLVGTGKVSMAAIHGHNGTVWATSKGFSASTAEVLTIAKAFTDASGIRANGIIVAGQKYFALKTDDRSIYGKKVSDFRELKITHQLTMSTGSRRHHPSQNKASDTRGRL